jgi:hypothetical protein
MKNLFVYYVAIILPFAALIYLPIANYMSSSWAIGFILAYVFIYRPIIDVWRLISKNVIAKKDIWKTYMPTLHPKYFKALYLP